MRLFFETSQQAWSFLLAVPIGFWTALCLDVGRGGGFLRFALDFLLLALAGVALVALAAAARDSAIRSYHWLGMLGGALLYSAGVGRLVGWIRQKRNQKKRKNRQESAV